MVKSRNEAERREAIIALGKSGDPAALEPLAEVFRGDANPELRELARKAGLHIRKQTAAVSAAPLPQTADDLPLPLPDEVIADKPKPTRVVTRDDEKAASRLIDEAMTLSMNNLTDRAVKSLRLALQTNPKLQDDNYFRSIAAEVLRIDAAEAIDRLNDKQHVRNFVRETKQQEKQKQTEKHLSEVEKIKWNVVIFDIIAFFFIMGIGPVLAILIFAQSLQGLLDSIALSVGSTEAVELSPEFQELTELSSFGTDSFSPVALILTALSLGTGYTIALVIYYGLLHLISRMLGGKGSLSYLVLKLTPMFNRYWLIFFFLNYIGVALAISQGFPPILACFSIIIVIYTLIVSGSISKKVGEAYNFGGAVGFIAVFIAGLVIFGLNLVVTLALSTAAAGFISQFAVGG
jgi:hypothetical protein